MQKYQDIMQLLLDVVTDDGGEKAEKSAEDADIVHEELAAYARRKYITKVELLAQCFVILLAGYVRAADG